MQTSQQELSQTYRNFSDTDIASLHAQIDTLTDDARSVLASEIQRRGMSDAQLSKLYASELRHEAKLDRRQKEHRKSVLSFLLMGDPYWTLAAIVALIVVTALLSLISSHH
jgi:hypothetical protein